MRFLFDLFIVVFAAFWLFQAAREIVHTLKHGETMNWIVVAMGLLVLTGFGGFFAASLAAEGVLSFQIHLSGLRVT